MRLFMIIDLYVGYKEACCYGVEKVENSTIIVMESEVWYFIRNQQIEGEQNRCAMACQGCGAVFLLFLKKAVDYFLKSIYC